MSTVNAVMETNLNPKQEVVYLNAANADTYASRKFSTIQAAIVTVNGTQSGSVAAFFSGTTATIYTQGSEKKNVTLVLYGE